MCVTYEKQFTHKFENNCNICVDKEICDGYVHGHDFLDDCDKKIVKLILQKVEHVMDIQ